MAFYLRKDRNEEDLSLGWLEYFSDLTPAERLVETLTCMTGDFKPGPKWRVLVVDVDEARSLLSNVSGLENVCFTYTPVLSEETSLANPCHASVFGMATLADALYQSAAQMLAMAVIDTHEWSKVKPNR